MGATSPRRGKQNLRVNGTEAFAARHDSVNGRHLARYHNILAVGAHPDDAELGCGGSLAAARKSGARVHIAALSRCEDEAPAENKDLRVKEYLAAAVILGAKPLVYGLPNREMPEHRREVMSILEDLQARLQPDLVLLPSLDDPHQDHQVVADAVVRTFRSKETLLQYEVLRHGTNTFTPTLFVDITDTLEMKIRALREYRSQATSRAYFDEASFRSLARTRGAQCGCEFAEGFMVQMMYL